MIFAAFDGLLAAAALAGILRRELNRPQGWRTVAGALTTKALATVFLIFPANELLQPVLMAIAGQGGMASLLGVSAVLGTALLWAVDAACIFAAFFLLLDRLAQPAIRIVTLGETLGNVFGFWMGRMRREKNGEAEHDFEITMASGEAVDEE